MEKEIEIGTKLLFPDGDPATVIRIEEYTDEEDDDGFYDAKRIVYVIDGDESKQEFDEMLDSRDGYKLHIMKLVD